MSERREGQGEREKGQEGKMEKEKGERAKGGRVEEKVGMDGDREMATKLAGR
jgi:hypothetical protein